MDFELIFDIFVLIGYSLVLIAILHFFYKERETDILSDAKDLSKIIHQRTSFSQKEINVKILKAFNSPWIVLLSVFFLVLYSKYKSTVFLIFFLSFSLMYMVENGLKIFKVLYVILAATFIWFAGEFIAILIRLIDKNGILFSVFLSVFSVFIYASSFVMLCNILEMFDFGFLKRAFIGKKIKPIAKLLKNYLVKIAKALPAALPTIYLAVKIINAIKSVFK